MGSTNSNILIWVYIFVKNCSNFKNKLNVGSTNPNSFNMEHRCMWKITQSFLTNLAYNFSSVIGSIEGIIEMTLGSWLQEHYLKYVWFSRLLVRFGNFQTGPASFSTVSSDMKLDCQSLTYTWRSETLKANVQWSEVGLCQSLTLDLRCELEFHWNLRP